MDEEVKSGPVDLRIEGPFMSLDGAVFVAMFSVAAGVRCVAVGFSAEEARRKAELLADDLASVTAH